MQSLREIVEEVCKVTGRKRLLAPLPFPLARIMGSVLQVVDSLTLGLIPDELVMTRDQVTLLESDNVVSAEAKAEGRDFAGLGLAPTSSEAVVSSYLWRFRKTGQFDTLQAR